MKRVGLTTRFDTVLELGPGDSLGISLAALLSGTERYVGPRHRPLRRSGPNLAAFRQLVLLFQARAPIPDRHEFPRGHPPLPDHSFPHGLLSPDWLADMLDARRVR